MSKIHEVIAELRGKGMFLSTEEGKLICKGPKGIITEELKDFIVENKPEMIRVLDGETQFELKKVVERPDRIPLSYAQERLWFLGELGQSDQYHIPGFLHFNGRPIPEYIEKAFQMLVDRHETLRTCFRKEDGEAYQLVLDRMEIPFRHVRLIDKGAKDPEVTAVTSEFAREPFDLENGPLFRIIVIELNERFVIGYCLHHIICDGWSITLLQQELNAIFRAFYTNEAPQFPPMEIQFADYAIWQRKVLSKEKLADKVAHWKQHLAGHQDSSFPLDFPRPQILSGQGGLETLTINITKSLWLRQYCKDNNITLFSLLLAVVYALMKRYCNQNDICIGLPIANRNHKAIEKMIGFFANTVVNRVQMTDDISLEELIMLSQKELIRSQDYQDVPFSKIVDAVQPARDASKTPIFQILVNYVNVANQKIKIGTNNSKNVEYEYSTSKFDLNFTFSEGAGEAVNIGIEYSTDLFLPETVKRIMKHYEIIVENLIRDATIKVSHIDLETRTENQLINQFNETNSNDWQLETLHERMYVDLLNFPDRIAVKDQKGSLTYRELAVQSSLLAEKLRHCGSKKGSFVGICLDRSCDLVISILAVLKTGSAYVAIDPNYPEDRMNYIVEDAALQILITDNNYGSKKAYANIANLINIEEVALSQQEIAPSFSLSTEPADPAYLIYTSGSTGKPKGVVQTHRTVDNLSKTMAKRLELDSADNKNVGQFASAGFDVSLQEIFFTLKNNLTLVITPHDVKRSPQDYIQFVAASQLNYIFLPTAYLDLFASEAITGNQQFPLLEKVIVAGEALRITKVVRDFFKHRQHLRLENHYGPTETHVATILPLEGNPDDWPFLPSIGKPVPNNKAFILNDALVKAPLGGIGELYVSGAGVASGYLHNDTLTAERFIDNPYGVEKLYKTGDLGRWRPDGEIEFYGRADQQVKIRGYRIEPGEIEKAIMEYPGVTLATVIVKERAGEKQLAAFYTADDSIDPSEVKLLIQKTLPNYMVPAFIKQLAEIPYNASGKVDRHSLHTVEIGDDQGEKFVAPQSPTEKQLATYWQDLLGIPKIGADDNFFELGGHSLLAVKLVSLISKADPDSHLKVMDVLKYPTLGSLAKYVDSGKSHVPVSPYILTFSDPGAVIIVPGMPGLSDGYHDMAVRLSKSRGVYGLQMKGFGQEEPLVTIEEMAAHNLEQIKEILPSGKLELYGHSFGGTVIYEMLRQLDMDRYAIENLVFLDSSPHLPTENMSPNSAIALAQAILWKYNVRKENLYHEISRIVREQPSDSWREQITNYLDLHIEGFEKVFFENMWKVVATSMSANYSLGDKQNFPLKMIIPNASIGMVDENAWKPFFNKVATYYTAGDHFSMIRA
ncbi:MAG: amino acid adenylation domain-containing protein, partial [Cyclobacteriaceae bacterium]